MKSPTLAVHLLCAIACGAHAHAAATKSDGTTANPEKKTPVTAENWQRTCDLKIGKTIIIRRSTDEPDPPGHTVLMRWRRPAEISDWRTISDKGAERFRAEQRAKAASAAEKKATPGR